MYPTKDPELLAVELAEALPMLEHPSGSTLVFAGLGSPNMAPRRLQTAEAILAFLRGKGAIPESDRPKPGKKARR
jgi:hypothetical protein